MNKLSFIFSSCFQNKSEHCRTAGRKKQKVLPSKNELTADPMLLPFPISGDHCPSSPRPPRPPAPHTHSLHKPTAIVIPVPSSVHPALPGNSTEKDPLLIRMKQLQRGPGAMQNSA